MSGLHIATAMHYRCLSLKQGLHSTPISLGTPVRNLDSLFLIFSHEKKTRGCPSGTFDYLCFAKKTLAKLAFSPQDTQKISP